MYEQILINALEIISRQPNFKPAMDDSYGHQAFTLERASKIAKGALEDYNNFRQSQKKETDHGIGQRFEKIGG